MSRKKPNFLLIMTDQQRFDTLGCMGNELIKTPNLDRLAEEGILFKNAYTQVPVCVPARQTLLTGQNAHNFPLLTNRGTFPEREIPTLPELLRKKGYFTQAMGKMHFKPPRNHMGFEKMELSEEMPAYRQDDEYLMFLKDKGYGDLAEPQGKRNKYHYQPQVSELPEELHVTTWTGNRTVDFLKNNYNRNFFCFVGFNKPHPAWSPCPPYHNMYNIDELPEPVCCEEDREPLDDQIPSENRHKRMEDPDMEKVLTVKSRYYGMITHIDKEVGKIIRTLEELNLRENTVIIFTSDHGELLGDHYAWGKRTFYEGAAHIPFIISWPAGFPGGEIREHLVSLYDILPTFLSLTGGEIPENLAGDDISAIINNDSAPWRNRFYGEYGDGLTMKFMIRWQEWKYIYYANGGREQLFNLKEDPGEINNLAQKQPDLCSSCRQDLTRYFKEEGFDEALNKNYSGLIKYEFTPIEKRSPDDKFPDWPDNLTSK